MVKMSNPSHEPIANLMAARLIALQVVYAIGQNSEIKKNWHNLLHDCLSAKIMKEEISQLENFHPAKELTEELLQGYMQHGEELQKKVIEQLAVADKKFQTLEHLLQGILILGAVELFLGKINPSISISAWVNVAKSYFSDHSPKLINAVLDGLYKKLSH